VKHLFAILFSMIALIPFDSAQGAVARPNILLIVLDDAGYGDIAGFADSRAPTPTLKQLGDEGVRFTRFYADATCRPPRVSLLTGKQTSKIAMSPDFSGISPEDDTLQKKLKQAGYTTHHIGKWHLGDTTQMSWPLAQGFDDWFGFLNQFVLRGPNDKGEIVPHRPTYNNPWLQTNNEAPKQYQGHLEDILADHVVEKIHSLKNSPSPWFINYWTLAPHNPAVPSDAYRKLFPPGKAGQYTALLKQLDDELARVFKALDETGQADNTIVVVLSDNGGTNEMENNNGPYSGEKAEYSEGGTRTPMIIRWPASMPDPALHSGRSYNGITAIYDLYPTLLSLADVTVSDTDGVNLLPLVVENKPRPPQALFWEVGTDLVYGYSVLDEQGQWRLDDNKLFNLTTDPYAERDVSALFPNKVTTLKQLFLDWRKQVHHLALNTEALHREQEPDTYKVTGDSFRRSPGYGGFTFVTSISPLVTGKPVTGVIAEQRGMWRMELTTDQRIRIHMGDHEAVTRPVTITACTPLVLSTYYLRSKLLPKSDHGVWVLTLNNEQIMEENWPLPAVFPDNFLEPTWVGQDNEGHPLLGASLESPQFYNEFYYRNDPWKVNRDPYWLTETFCQPPAK
jgi:arylsulfatase A-like enzyme